MSLTTASGAANRSKALALRGTCPPRQETQYIARRLLPLLRIMQLLSDEPLIYHQACTTKLPMQLKVGIPLLSQD